MNSGKKLLALSECVDALEIIEEQAKRAVAQLAALSKAAGDSPDDEDSVVAAKLQVWVSKHFAPLRHRVQRRHDELAMRFTEEWSA